MSLSTPSTQQGGVWKNLALWKKILIGMIVGIIIGAIMGPQAEILKPIGTLFINAIKCSLYLWYSAH